MINVAPEGLPCHRGWAGLAWLGEESQLMTSPSGGREESRACIWHSGFSEGYPRELLLPHLTGGANRELAYFGCLGHWEKKESRQTWGCSTTGTAVSQTDARGSKRLWTTEKETIKPNWEMTLKNPENCQSPKDVSEAPWISSSTEQNIALCKSSLQRLRMVAIFSNTYYSAKKKKNFKRHIKKQGHMAKSKG